MKITKTLFIGWLAENYTKEGGRYAVREHNPTWDEDFKLLATKEVELEVPEVDARGQLIESLQRKKNAVIGKATAEAKILDDQIQQLLALDAPAEA